MHVQQATYANELHVNVQHVHGVICKLRRVFEEIKQFDNQLLNHSLDIS